MLVRTSPSRQNFSIKFKWDILITENIDGIIRAGRIDAEPITILTSMRMQAPIVVFI